MKQLLILLFMMFSSTIILGQVVITDDVDTIPDPSALLQLNSIDKGLILPRMTTTQRTNITMPIHGLLVYDIDDDYIYFFDSTNWVALGQNLSIIKDQDEDTYVATEHNQDEDIIRFSIEGMEAFLMDRTANGRHRINQTINGSNVLIGMDVAQDGIGGRNTLIGQEVGELGQIFADDNVMIGYRAGRYNESDDNVFIGSRTGEDNTTGHDNTFVGRYAGNENTTGHSNTLIGNLAGRQNFDGINNTAVGVRAAHDNLDADNNTFIGHSAGYSTISGGDNVAVGYRAAYVNRTGVRNTVVGTEAAGQVLNNRDMANDNTIMGYRAAYSLDSSSLNTIIGSQAASFITEGNGNSIVGANAGRFMVAGDNNTFMGNAAGQSNSQGSENIFFGFNAGFRNYYGDNNLAIGSSALINNYAGENNIAIGTGSLGSNEDGHGNIAIGQNALNTVASTYDHNNNIAIGNGAGALQRGDDNVYIGTNVGSFNSDVTGSLFLGLNAGNGTIPLGLGNNNTLLGASTGFSNSINNIQNATAIGAGARVALSNSVILGDADESALRVGIGTDQPAAMLDIDAYYGSHAPLRVSQDGTQRFLIDQAGRVKVGSFTGVNSTSQMAVDGSFDVLGDAHIREQLMVGFGGGETMSSSFIFGVKGNAIMEELWVRNENDWPDYVFTSGHNLMSIDELDEFISKHNHLPKIPAAEKIESDGQNVGENQRLLVEKIEEMTLYIIQLKKEIDQLKEDIKRD